jgi:SAM-dependent methyltransferase
MADPTEPTTPPPPTQPKETATAVKERAPSRSTSCCRLCAGDAAYVFSAREMMIGTRDRFDYEACEKCGALQIAEMPDNLDRYYAEDYYTDRQRKLVPRSKTGRWLRRSGSNFRLQGGALVRLVSGRRYARFDWFRRTGIGLDDAVLDVGCGSGRLLTRMAREGFSKLSGIDPRCPEPESPTPGIILSRERPEQHVGSYRLVMAHHSFEHMPRPVEAFEAMARLVDPGGYLLLRVPLADSWASRHFGPDWVQLDAPRHLQLPTRKSIEILAHNCGLHVEHVEDDSGSFQIWGSLLYRRGHSLAEAGRGGRRKLSLFRRLTARWQARRLSRAGLGDQACFYLRRN